MDPLRDRLCDTPRDVYDHAFFREDRAVGRVQRKRAVDTSVSQFDPIVGAEVQLTVRSDRRCKHSSRKELFSLTRHRKRIDYYRFSNLVKHRQGRYKNGSAGPTELDPTFASYAHIVDVACYASASAEKEIVKARAGAAPRLRVVVLFAVGSEAVRHGLTGFLDSALRPTLLLVVPGVETDGSESYRTPDGKVETVDEALGRWAVGLNDQMVRSIVTARFGFEAPYDVVVLGAYSTGHMGLSASITNRWISLAKVERIVMFDCLYGEAGPALKSAKAERGDIEIICYVATSGGNSFKGYDPHAKGPPPAYKDLSLGGVPGWRYVNLYFNPDYFMLASARVLEEAIIAQTSRAGDAPIITPDTRETAGLIDALKAYARDPQAPDRSILPPRGGVVSDMKLFTAIYGPPRAPVVELSAHALSAKPRIGPYAYRFQKGLIARALGGAQLLGWPSYGESWHDLLLVEFGWEYLFGRS